MGIGQVPGTDRLQLARTPIVAGLSHLERRRCRVGVMLSMADCWRPSNSALPRRSAACSDDDEGVTHPQVRPDPAFGLLNLYDDGLPHVYGYLLPPCGDTGLPEDLTAEYFLPAV